MIERIVPARVVAVDVRHDLLDAELFAPERAAIDGCAEGRRREFATARACAHTALRGLGMEPRPVLRGRHGEPRWPAGVVGSVTHCDGYRACALARAGAVATIGIDAEPNAPLPNAVLGRVAGASERLWVERRERARPAVRWDRLLFSAKESVYKAWFPLARRWLGADDIVIAIGPRDLDSRDGGPHDVDPHDVGSHDVGPHDADPCCAGPHEGVFTARLLVVGPPLGGGRLTGFSGRWMVRDGLIVTAVAAVRIGPRQRLRGRR